MKQFTQVSDVPSVQELIAKVLYLKGKQELNFAPGKNLSMLFFNPSLRTRMSTQKAAYNLGMNVFVLDANQGWKLETKSGAIMDQDAQEHLSDAVRVLSSYSDVFAVRSFPELNDKQTDYSEEILKTVLKFSNSPVLSLESATRHPLQSLTDMVTIMETGIKRPKIAVTWAPHPKVLPQAVVNSFLEWSSFLDAEVVVTHPIGYELDPEFMKGASLTYNQDEALASADFVYAKNWSTVSPYGENILFDPSWMLTPQKMALTKNPNNFMHCLPIRRNVIAADSVIDRSLVYRQAENRVWAAQAVLKELLNDSK